MIGEQIGEGAGAWIQAQTDSAAQLRREAAKARTLSDAAFGEDERRRLADVAVTLEQEANAIEAALARKPRAS